MTQKFLFEDNTPRWNALTGGTLYVDHFCVSPGCLERVPLGHLFLLKVILDKPAQISCPILALRHLRIRS